MDLPNDHTRLFATSDHRRIDVSQDAAEWSHEIIQVLPNGQVGTHQLRTDDAVARALEVLSDFDPESDMLLLIGDPVKIALCSAIVAQRCSTFTVLRFDRLSNRYYPVELSLPT